jgi:hypothetical protein
LTSVESVSSSIAEGAGESEGSKPKSGFTSAEGVLSLFGAVSDPETSEGGVERAGAGAKAGVVVLVLVLSSFAAFAAVTKVEAARPSNRKHERPYLMSKLLNEVDRVYLHLLSSCKILKKM